MSTQTSLVTVVIADVDSFVTSVADHALQEAGFVTHVAADGAAARRWIAASASPLVLVVARELFDSAEDLCEAAHAEHRAYVVALVAGGRPRDIAEALERGADDCVTKPFSPGELVARVRSAARMLTALPPLSLGLREALARAAGGASGEISVSQGDVVGRIWLEKGRIAWAQSNDRAVSLRTLLGSSTTMTVEAVAEVMEEAKRSKRNVLDVLVDSGLASQADVIAAVERYLREVVRGMLLLPSPTVVFAPAMRVGTWTGVTFSLADVLPRETHRNLPIAVAPVMSIEPPRPGVGCDFAQSCGACADAARRLEEDLRSSGADGIAIVHGPTGETLASAGAKVDPDVVRSGVRILSLLAESDRPDQLVVTALKSSYLLSATSCPDAYVVMVGSRKKIGIGSLKLEASRIAAVIYPDEEASSQRLERSRRSAAPPLSSIPPSTARSR